MLNTWITCDQSVETPLFQKKFNLDKLPTKAEIDISALGYFTLLINGKKGQRRTVHPCSNRLCLSSKFGGEI